MYLYNTEEEIETLARIVDASSEPLGFMDDE
jgi:hypothetical protein